MNRVKSNIKGLVIYFAIAVVGASISLSSRFVFDDYLSLSYSLSVGLSYLLGMVWGFFMTKAFAFDAKKSGNTSRELIKYSIVAFSALGLTVITASVSLEFFKWYIKNNSEEHTAIKAYMSMPIANKIDKKFVAQIAGIIAGFFVNYFGHRFLTFRTTGAYEKYKNRKSFRKRPANRTY